MAEECYYNILEDVGGVCSLGLCRNPTNATPVIYLHYELTRGRQTGFRFSKKNVHTPRRNNSLN